MSEGITGAQCRNALATPSPVCTGTRSRSDKVICSIHRFGQLTWLSPGGGPRARAQGPLAGSTAEVEVKRDVSRLAQKPWRLLKGVQAPGPHLHLGQSLTPQ